MEVPPGRQGGQKHKITQNDVYTDGVCITAQSPFWKKFRETLVVNPESTTGNWVRE
jgi:hypothetical protein